jgi:integrase
MRAGEIFSLTWGAVDFANGVLALKNTKNGRTRAAYLTEEAKKMLQVRQPESPEPDQLVFPNRNGDKIVQVSNSFGRAVDKLKLNQGITDPRDKVVFHTLRHTFASWLVMAGTDLYVVKELLGHRDFKMTSRYAHLGQNPLQAAVRRFEKHMDKRINKQNKKIVDIKSAQNES